MPIATPTPDAALDSTSRPDFATVEADAESIEADMAMTDSSIDDADGDGIADAVDNCPMIGNVDQMDTDDDGLGDACDARPNTPDLKLSGHFLLFGGLLVDDTHSLNGVGRSAHGVVTDGTLKLRGGFSP